MISAATCNSSNAVLNSSTICVGIVPRMLGSSAQWSNSLSRCWLVPYLCSNVSSEDDMALTPRVALHVALAGFNAFVRKMPVDRVHVIHEKHHALALVVGVVQRRA